MPSLIPAPAASPAELLAQLLRLRDAIVHDARLRLDRWRPEIERLSFLSGAENLAHYLALRRHDLRALQRTLMPFGLSSLGRLEGRVQENLQAVLAALAAIAGVPGPGFPTAAAFFAGEDQLVANTDELFGRPAGARAGRILVTLGIEAAEDPAHLETLLGAGTDAVRINCAHDDAAVWSAMIRHLRRAEALTGRSARLLMDLAGPKCRTGAVRHPDGRKRLRVGDALLLVPPGGLADAGDAPFAAECTLPELLAAVAPGQRVFVDDGRLGGTLEAVAPAGARLRIRHAPAKGGRLKADKGLNFPDTLVRLSPLTARDLADLDFVAAHADLIGYSFVQDAADVRRLQEELARRRPDDWRSLGLVAKIETPRAVLNLPELLVAAAGRQPFALMIARGDLAVELGFERLAEMQEEIMWLAEAAHVPVIWATQVLESLVKKGLPSRGEMTDAAMAARAECIMLNKGPHLQEGVEALDRLFVRMGEHQHKKTAQLRALRSW
jgi:pyruvate kinase